MLKITVRAFAAAVILGVQSAFARPPKFRLFSGGGFGFCCAVKREIIFGILLRPYRKNISAIYKIKNLRAKKIAARTLLLQAAANFSNAGYFAAMSQARCLSICSNGRGRL